MSRFTSLLPLAFLLLLSLCHVSFSLAQSSSQCFICPVPVCSNVLPTAPSITLQVPATGLGTGQQFCEALNRDLPFWVNTAPSQACVQQVAGYACSVMLAVNATETNCNASSIGSGVANFSQLFTLGCQSELSCLSTLIGGELQQFHACDNFTAFLDALPVMAALIPPPSSSSSSSSTAGTGGAPQPTNGAAATAPTWTAMGGMGTMGLMMGTATLLQLLLQ